MNLQACASSFSSFTQRCRVAIFCFANENTPASKNVKELMKILDDFFEETKNSRNSYQLRIVRSSRSQMFFKIGVLGFLGLKACKFIKKRLQHRCFAVKFTNFFRKLFFTEHLWWLVLN